MLSKKTIIPVASLTLTFKITFLLLMFIGVMDTLRYIFAKDHKPQTPTQRAFSLFAIYVSLIGIPLAFLAVCYLSYKSKQYWLPFVMLVLAIPSFLANVYLKHVIVNRIDVSRTETGMEIFAKVMSILQIVGIGFTIANSFLTFFVMLIALFLKKNAQ